MKMRFASLLFTLLPAVLLSACNLKEGIRETGDAVQQGVHNIGEAAREAPESIGRASNEVESDIRD